MLGDRPITPRAFTALAHHLDKALYPTALPSAILPQHQQGLIVALACTGVVALVLLGIAAGQARSKRAIRARLASLATRMGTRIYSEEGDRLEATVDRLELLADESAQGSSATLAENMRLRLALDAIGQGVVVCDDSGQVVFRNRYASSMMGSRQTEILAAQTIQEMLDASLTGGASDKTLELYGPPRQTIHVRAQPIAGDSGPLGVIAVAEDVTERRRLESIRRDFVANVSHELKTPVGAMALLAETFEDEEDTRIAKRLAGRIYTEAMRVNRIIDDLLNLSRIEAEENPPIEPVDMASVIREAMEGSVAFAEKAKIAIEAKIPDDTLIVMGDRRELLSAISNLIENSVHYSESGSRVVIEARLTGAKLEINVRDHGIGIPARDLERIFERFYRVDQGRSRHTGGTGLGLSIVRHVIRRHLGDVTVSSREGEGSTFVVTLPVQLSPIPAAFQATSTRGSDQRGPLPGQDQAVQADDGDQRGPLPGQDQAVQADDGDQRGPLPGQDQAVQADDGDQRGPLPGQDQAVQADDGDQRGPLPGQDQAVQADDGDRAVIEAEAGFGRTEQSER